MSGRKAAKYFLGKTGSVRLNCAQAVAAAFKDKGLISEREFQLFSGYGSGRAPEGHCGSLHAAMVILRRISPDKVKELQVLFSAKAGALKCKQIRLAKKIPCSACVELAADFVGKVYQE